ncbi:MAG: serine hydrolase [Pseudomonadota bacterium]
MRLWILVSVLFSAPVLAEFDYFGENRLMIRNGVQAVLTCNGLFTSERSLELVQREELAYLTQERFGGPVDQGLSIDRERKAVMVGGGIDGIPITAVYRDGIGCVVLAPDQTLDAIADLPVLPEGDRRQGGTNQQWPHGDQLAAQTWPTNIDQKKLVAASNRIFEPELDNQITLSLLVIHKGQLIHERYREGIDYKTRTRTWSTAKSIAVTLIGMLVDQGMLELDEPLPVDWLPKVNVRDPDPRTSITLRNVLHMSSGLYPVDSCNQEYATGSGLAYWAGASSVESARNRGLIREPGSHWDYENYDTLLAVLAMKNVLGNQEDYLNFPRKALLDKIGMHNTLLSTDRFGDFILSSQVYTNARDLARFGLLYLNNGIWQGERLISQEWIDFVRTPAPSTADDGNFYGGQFWLVPESRDDVPKDAYATAGNRGQYVIIVPSHDLVIVRRGLDYASPHMNRWDIAAQVLEAFDSRNAANE